MRKEIQGTKNHAQVYSIELRPKIKEAEKKKEERKLVLKEYTVD